MMRRLNLSRRNVTVATAIAIGLGCLTPSFIHNIRLTMAQGVWCNLSIGDQLDSPRVIRYGKDCP
jgi:hypothetical protein